jgi:hypothetical protein
MLPLTRSRSSRFLVVYVSCFRLVTEDSQRWLNPTGAG